MSVALHTVAGPVVPLVEARAWRRQVMRERVGAAAVAALAGRAHCPPVESWRALRTLGDTVVLRVSTVDDGDLIVKVALSASAGAGLDRHAQLLGHLAQLPAVGEVVPELMSVGSLGRHRYVVEHAVAGVSLTTPPGPETTAAVLRTSARVHEATAITTPDDMAGGMHTVLATLDADLARLARVCRTAGRQHTIDRLAEALAVALDGQQLVTATVHGDLWAGNVLVAGAPGDPSAIAIVDWERAALRGLPEVDQTHYLLAAHPGGFAAGVQAVLTASPTTVGAQLADIGVPTLNPQLDSRLCAVLAWLGHVGAGLDTTRRFGAGPLWVRSEVSTVLDLLRAHDHLLAGLADCRA